MESSTFIVLDENGKEVECEILFTYENPNTGKNYIVYTDNTTDDEGNTKVMAAIFNPEEDDPDLLPIETEEEWEMIENILTSLQDDDFED